MHLRSNTFFSALFMSLLFIASTFAIPISRDSNSVSNPSAKLVDREVVPQSVDAQADASPTSKQSTQSPTQPVEAQVTIYASPLPEKDEAALKAGIENMLSSKPIIFVKFFEISQPKADISTLKNAKKIPVTVINYDPSHKRWSSETPQYQFKFILTGKPAGPDSAAFNSQDSGWGLMGKIERASLSNGGKQPTGTFWRQNRTLFGRFTMTLAMLKKGRVNYETGGRTLRDVGRLNCWQSSRSLVMLRTVSWPDVRATSCRKRAEGRGVDRG
ncbi:hypothetical protein DFH05DRAFT_970286 [Lentinula detonsa]|uniref:Uncharacterized protein n=1 Tax=Lentinula detonsa TaxID=2804962 RepID=A0A9W8P4E4_9AGAR|nr:hypothetical protein DFH05DRAFT_970286 [Lentinula detonsa]